MQPTSALLLINKSASKPVYLQIAIKNTRLTFATPGHLQLPDNRSSASFSPDDVHLYARLVPLPGFTRPAIIAKHKF